MQLTLPAFIIALLISGTHSRPITPGAVARGDDYTTPLYCLLRRGFNAPNGGCPNLGIKRDSDSDWSSSDFMNLGELKRDSDSDWSSSDFMNLGELKREDNDWSSNDFMNLGELKRDSDSDWSSSDFMNLGELKR